MVKLLRVFENEWDYVIIADCRFPNEVEMLRLVGFDVLHARVTRPNFDNGLSEEQSRHVSEVALDDFLVDIPVDNSGTLVSLRNHVRNIVEKRILGKQRRYVKSKDLCDRCKNKDCPDIAKNTPYEFEDAT